jgi:hypothetical protein
MWLTASCEAATNQVTKLKTNQSLHRNTTAVPEIEPPRPPPASPTKWVVSFVYSIADLFFWSRLDRSFGTVTVYRPLTGTISWLDLWFREVSIWWFDLDFLLLNQVGLISSDVTNNIVGFCCASRHTPLCASVCGMVRLDGRTGAIRSWMAVPESVGTVLGAARATFDLIYRSWMVCIAHFSHSPVYINPRSGERCGIVFVTLPSCLWYLDNLHQPIPRSGEESS